MKRILLIVCTVVIALLLLLPIYGGKKAQFTLDELVEHMNATAPGSANWASYDYGWFSSEAVLHMDVAAYFGLLSEEPLIFPLQLDLSHGPIIVDRGIGAAWFEGRWYLDSQHEAWIEENLQVEGEGPFFTSHFKMALSGVVTFHEQTLPFSLIAHDRLLSVRDYEGQGTYRPYGALTYKGGFAKASLLADGRQFLLEGADVALTSHLNDRQGPFAVPGDANLRVHKVRVLDERDAVFALDDIELATSFAIDREEPEMGAVNILTSFRRAEMLGEAISDGIAEVSLRRMSLAFYNAYMQLLQDAKSENGVPLQSMQVLTLANQTLLPLGPELLVPRVSFSAPEGQFMMNGHIRVREHDATGQIDLFALIALIDAEVHVAVDKPLAYKLVQQRAANSVDEEAFTGGDILNKQERDAAMKDRAETHIDELLSQGFIKDEGGQFITHLKFVNGVALVNDQALPLPF